MVRQELIKVLRKATKQKIIQLFTDACSITTSSGNEAEMALWIKNKLEPIGWEVWIDDAGHKNKSNTGNLYAYLELDPKVQTLVFAAHMDTVAKKEDKIKVVFDGETFKSDGKSILGADNRGGIVPLVYTALGLKKDVLKNNILLFFPTREESGMMGSSFFEFNRSKVKFVFNMDGGDNPGTFVYKSLGFLNFKLKVHGLASHAAAAYDKGKNAILAASELVVSLKLGKDEKEGTTLNIGSIEGGGATNIVPDLVELKGELRAFEEKKMTELFNELEKKAEEIAKKRGVKIEVLKDADLSFAPPFEGDPDSEICKACRKAAEGLGLPISFQTAYYTSDANNFSGKGLETIVVSRGGKAAHSKDEQISLSDLVKTSKLVEKLAYGS